MGIMLKQSTTAVRDLAVGTIVLHWDSLTELRVVEISHSPVNDMAWVVFEGYWRDGTVAPISGSMGGWEDVTTAEFVVQERSALEAKKVDELRKLLRLMLTDGMSPRPTRIERMRKVELLAWIEVIETAEATARAACNQAWEEDDAEFDN